MSQIERLSLRSERDGLELPLIAISPDGPARGVVQIAHGMCEHKERYLPFMEFLAENGCAAVIHDHRGHGETAQKRAELGYFGADGANALVDDLHQITLWAKERFPGLPLYLFGHSMGSLAARIYLRAHDGEIAGLFLSGSPARNPLTPLALIAAKIIGLFFGERSRSKVLKALTLGPFYRAFREESKCAWLSSDRAAVRAYEESPLCGFTFTNNGFAALYDLMIMAYDAHAKAKHPELPVSFLSGERDPCRGGDKGFEGAVGNMIDRGYARVGGRLYEGMRHEILNEPNRAEVYKDILETLAEWEAQP